MVIVRWAHWAAAALLALNLISLPVTGWAQEVDYPVVQVYVDGDMLVPGRVVQNRTLVPLRALAERLGLKVTWDAQAQAAILTTPQAQEPVVLGPPLPSFEGYPAVRVFLNGRELHSDVPGIIYGGSTLVPLRFIAEALGLSVEWDGLTRTARLTSLPVNATGPKKPETSEPEQPVSRAGRYFCIESRSGSPVPGVELFVAGSLVGTADDSGCLSVERLGRGQYEYTLFFRHGNGNNGMRGTFSLTGKPGERQRIQVDVTPAEGPLGIITLPAAEQSARATAVHLRFDDAVPDDLRDYLLRLQADLDPVLTALMGPPLQSGSLHIVYDPSHYASLSGDLSELYVTRLPRLLGENDPDLDAWFLVEYTHKYLQGRSVPVLTSRTYENLSHAIRTVAGTYLNQRGIRRIGSRGVAYYLALRPVLETLGSGILLNTGPAVTRNAGGEWSWAEWEDASYQRLNPLTIEYAVSVWLTLADARFQVSGQLDFFRRFQEQIWSEDPQTPEQFYAMITTVVGGPVEGLEAGEWLRRTSLFRELPDATHFVRPLPVRGSFWYITGLNDPNRIYLFAIRRPPATLLSGTVSLTLTDEAGRVATVIEVSLAFQENGEPPFVGVPVNLPPGTYTAVITGTVDGVQVEASQSFTVSNQRSASP